MYPKASRIYKHTPVGEVLYIESLSSSSSDPTFNYVRLHSLYTRHDTPLTSHQYELQSTLPFSLKNVFLTQLLV